MAKKEFANGNATLSVSITGGSGSASITGSPSTKVQAGGVGVFKGQIDFMIPSGAGIPGVCLSIASFSGSIPATALKNMVEGSPVSRKDDEITVSVPGQNPSTGAPCSFPATVKVANAGQVKVKGE